MISFKEHPMFLTPDRNPKEDSNWKNMTTGFGTKFTRQTFSSQLSQEK